MQIRPSTPKMGGCALRAVLICVSLLPATICGQVVVAQPFLDARRDEVADIGPIEQDSDSLDAEDDFLDLDIDQLRRISVVPALETVVTSVSRHESTVGRSPTAVFVITQEMIRRSGARSIPEALRLAPGLQVAKVDGNKWAITIRGFNSRFANKLLVQIDGRTIYSPLFAGAIWDTQDLLLADIERIEVVRGPGATVWGSNAVNGVINIITKHSRDTSGAYVTGGGGTEEEGFAGARVGGVAADGDLHWRVSGKWFERGNGTHPHSSAFDDWTQGRGGFRMDWEPTCSDTLTFMGDYYQGISGNTHNLAPVGHLHVLGEDKVRGGYLLARWTHALDETSDWSLQLYFDRADRSLAQTDTCVDTFDIDFQHQLPWGDSHRLIWGLSYRSVLDSILAFPSGVFAIVPERRRANLLSGFVQDEITLIDEELFFTIGTKLEENDYTGFEVQPSARLLWQPDPRRAAWVAVSRAVRVPSRAEDDLRIGLGGPLLLLGSRDLLAEELIAYEVGYRAQPAEWFSWDIAAFYNTYEDLIAPGATFPVFVYGNLLRGNSYGVELSGRALVADWWTLSASYTFLRVDLFGQPVLPIGGSVNQLGNHPRNQVFLMSSWDVAENVECDLMARYVDNLPAESIPSYVTVDLRLAWHPACGWECGVVGQNLLDRAHFEFGNDVTGTHATEVQRGVYGYVQWSR